MRALYVLVLGSGAVLMALEVLGSRLIAPFFGSSIYVWGSLISVFLTALSVGYYLGGTLADKWPAQSTLTYLLAGSGALTALIPTMAEPVASAFTALGARAGALAAATVIFLPATLVMGMVSPVAVRLGVADLANLGKASGRLSAISTAGSIAGTLVTTFFLVPLTGTKLLITGVAGGLFGLAALSYVRDRKYTMATAAAAWALFLVVFGPHGALTGTAEYVPGLGLLRTIYATESAYHDIRVMDGNDQRYLRFNNSWQTSMSLSDPYESPTCRC